MPKRKQPTVEPQKQDQLDQLLALAKATPDPSDDVSTQIQTLDEWRTYLGVAAAWVRANLDDLRGKYDISPSQAATQLQAGADAVGTKIAALQELQRKRANFAARAIKRGKTDRAGDGQCYVHFVNVGMGDCTLVASPKGRRIMIDCGSDSLSDVILDPDFDEASGVTAAGLITDTFRSNTFLGTGTAIDFLFLTHPDADHHNQLKPLLEPLGVSFGVVYYGGADAIEGYTSSAYLKEAAGTTPAVLRKVTVRQENARDGEGKVVVTRAINDAAVTATAGQEAQIGYEFVDPTSKALVVYYEAVEGGDFRVSILAGNVTGAWSGDRYLTRDNDVKTATEEKCEASEPNKRSLIVMVECFGERILVCGDATALTEQSVVGQFSTMLPGVTYLRMGHHGSPTSSAKVFVDELTGLTAAVASTGGEKTTVHRLPKQAIIGLYPDRVAAGATAHDIYAFQSEDPVAHVYFTGITRKVYATGSNDTVPLVLAKAGGA
jgi:beta-lactamase superfamily II metal-dependent hydrolase